MRSYDRHILTPMPPMSTFPRIALVLLLGAWLPSCATQPQQAVGGATFIIVRHAEKVPDDSSDPPLTKAGHVRADALATSLADAPLMAIYATAFQRTQQTAAPSARARRLQIVSYDAKSSATGFAAQLKRTHPAGTVLVVGHSNTAPDIASALCNCEVPAMADTEYDRRMTIRIAPNGAATLTTTRDR